MIIDQSVLLGLNNLLGLNYTGAEQDWDIEFADSNRVHDFIKIAQHSSLSVSEKYAVISLILASYDDFLAVKEDTNQLLWSKITDLINPDREIYKDLLSYWARWDKENDDRFLITPLVRSTF
ncbi:hypothetical protein FO440_09025 [Mucilaginibacter corticis]|uniref:Uncharacterized protein n=1 Tax=Mucilaginibacter corticis TaxID=2597670 RepID=A0A556MWK7_9SPHI|nr:hypothetical protein [Mucilaginibacter corticis]TSJ44301.1 hypothetical protein FO440_09025 [Mucilaginibacter corticis]